jgi:hypothetical protein
MKLKVGDRVRIVKQLHDHKNYPWIPDLIGKEGIIISIFPKNRVPNFDDADAAITVKTDEIFQRGFPAENEHFLDYIPGNVELSNIWNFVMEELQVI